NQGIGGTGVDAYLLQILRIGRKSHVTQYGAALLRKAHEVEYGSTLAFQVRGHGDQGTDGDNPGSTNATHQQVVDAAQVALLRRRQAGDQLAELFAGFQTGGLAQLPAFDGDEA